MIQSKPNQGALDSVLAWVSGDSSDNDVVRLACDLLIPRKGDLYIVYVIEVHRSMPVSYTHLTLPTILLV